MPDVLQVAIPYQVLINIGTTTCLTSVLDKDISLLISGAAILCIEPINTKYVFNKLRAYLFATYTNSRRIYSLDIFMVFELKNNGKFQQENATAAIRVCCK